MKPRHGVLFVPVLLTAEIFVIDLEVFLGVVVGVPCVGVVCASCMIAVIPVLLGDTRKVVADRILASRLRRHSGFAMGRRGSV